jgi:hypothetical protein
MMRMTHTAGRLASATLTSPSAQPRTPLAAGQHFGKTPTVTHLQPRCHTGTDQVHAINKDVRRACGAALALGLLDAGQCIAGLYPLKVLQVLLQGQNDFFSVFAFWLFVVFVFVLFSFCLAKENKNKSQPLPHTATPFTHDQQLTSVMLTKIGSSAACKVAFPTDSSPWQCNAIVKRLSASSFKALDRR